MAAAPIGALMRGRVLLRGVGIGLIALAVCLAGLVGYELLFTRAQSTATAQAAVAELDSSWATSMDAHDLVPAPAIPTMSVPKEGATFGKVYIPRLKDRAWGLPLVQGIEPQHIDAGFAHFPHSALPGQVGNLAIAAHRATHLEPLAEVDRLRTGDMVYIRTRTAWFAYRLTRDRIVKPTDTWVVDPVPGKASTAPTSSLITLVTCEPRWGSTSRWIWWGELAGTFPATWSVGALPT